MLKLASFSLIGMLAAGAAMACDTAEVAVPARAKANLTGLFSDQDYPAAAVAAREQGPVGFTLDVGANGRVTACTVTQSSGSASLDQTTCALLSSRARFSPATDASGSPVPDSMAGRISWKLPPAPAS